MISFPTTPDIGDVYTYANRSWMWNGNGWQSSNYKPDGAIVADAPPANPESGWMWWDRLGQRLFVYNGSAWVEPNTSTTYLWDADAVDYIYRVQVADGQELEKATQKAINAFVIGCKTDGIWSSIKASCIMAGAKTLEGAITPLVGDAPSNFNFTSLDYDRKTGIRGNGSNKYLNSNRSNSADPQNNNHIAVYVTDFGTPGQRQYFLDSGYGSGPGVNQIAKLEDGRLSVALRRNGGALPINTVFSVEGFGGLTRNASSYWVNRFNGVNFNSNVGSISPGTGNINLFRSLENSIYSSARMSFYSIGEHLDLALLDARLSTLMSELQASIQ